MSFQRNEQSDSGGSERGDGRLGIRVEPLTPALAARLGMKEWTQDLAVIGVDPVGPAADAGVRAGDVIEAANGQSVRSAADLNGVLDKAGEPPVLLLINRQGQSAYLAIRPRRN